MTTQSTPSTDAADQGGGHEGGHGGTRAIIAALLANIGIAIAKFVAFLITGASSMLAEAIHSLADSGNQVLLLVGGRRAERAATPQHPFGYGRDRYIYAFIVSIVLFSVGGLFAIYEGVHKLQHPEELTSPAIAIPMLAARAAMIARVPPCPPPCPPSAAPCTAGPVDGLDCVVMTGTPSRCPEPVLDTRR